MIVALDGTPLIVSTGGVARYTLELARALASEFPEDQYWLLSDQFLPTLEELARTTRLGLAGAAGAFGGSVGSAGPVRAFEEFARTTEPGPAEHSRTSQGSAGSAGPVRAFEEFARTTEPGPAEHSRTSQGSAGSAGPVRAFEEFARTNLHMSGPPKTFAERKWWLFGLGLEMRRRGVDLFHGTDFSVPYLARRPSVMTLHDLSPWSREEWRPDAVRVRRRTPTLLRLGLASMVITPSEAVRREAIERFGLNPDRVVAVPLAASEAFRRVERQRSESSSSKPYFLFVGTLEPRKNLARLMEAWREVRKSIDVDLVLAGRARSGFPAPLPEPGLHVLGPVPEADLPALYSGALACVYPSLYEGFGLPVLEAMQCGTVVVTSRDPAIMEVTGAVSGSRTAVHVDASDTRALAEALAAVARTPGNFADQRSRALARAAEFSWRRTARRTREVYEAARRVFRGR